MTFLLESYIYFDTRAIQVNIVVPELYKVNLGLVIFEQNPQKRLETDYVFCF